MKEYILITLATIPYAIGIALFLDPNDLAPGGLTGISILVNRLTGIDTGSLFFMLDTFVVMFAGLVFRDPEAMVYAAISTTITTTALDKVLYGHDGARLIYIISGKEEAITESLLYSLQAGVTVLHGEGAYTQQKKKILMCVVDKKRAVKIEEIVKETDRNAFLIITSANEIYGEGYKNLFQEKI